MTLQKWIILLSHGQLELSFGVPTHPIYIPKQKKIDSILVFFMVCGLEV